MAATPRRRGGTKRRRPAPRARRAAAAPGRLREEVGAQLGRHAPDALAIALGVAGCITALGMFSGLAGPLGDALDTAAAVLLGRGRVVVPVALLVGAAGALAGARADDDDGRARQGIRLGVGLALGAAAVVGCLHLAGGSPDTQRLAPLREAGGVLGALVGAPLRALLGPAGAVIVLVAAGLLGVLLVAGTGLRQVVAGAVVAARWVAARARSLLVLPSPALDDAPYAPDRPHRYDDLAPGAAGPVVDLVAAEAGAGPGVDPATRVPRRRGSSGRTRRDEGEEAYDEYDEYDEDDEYDETTEAGYDGYEELDDGDDDVTTTGPPRPASTRRRRPRPSRGACRPHRC
ncbi:MAG: hypothetical protein KatS3mg009_1856 [Acidimicrobiia bacterium]|nr:MAG: hypothetical protein KatS3mg009_1856 [Acidimicrobiia bacterium]